MEFHQTYLTHFSSSKFGDTGQYLLSFEYTDQRKTMTMKLALIW